MDTDKNAGEWAEKAKASAEFIAMMLVYVSRAVVESAGEEAGMRMLKKGLREFGRARGRNIRQKVDAQGLKPTVEAFAENYDFPLFAAYKAEREISGRTKTSRISLCPLAAFWDACGEKAIGLLYCDEVDDGIREGFDEKLAHSNPKNLLRGDDLCIHIDEFSE